ncbi:heme-binding domain-containing protein [Paraflavitalea sp. CAU 1676]|uniref:heme-binding domain-containing protein n=1 Tax=Paraflavitalea sp. CAU 1676 TaxID=3032598 RepID=UPI0023D988E8|nr:heme-binding domain-containing protein [Paraflavitalea sp. CAU 1676]MDF2188664.1 heme-binding domain-containing protein [Paraflavitalea sp. CAU 1676]
MRALKKIAWGLLIVLVLLQFIPRSVNKSEKTTPADIANNYQVPVQVQLLLKKACYDCHSNNTRYPWYADLQPFRLLLDQHVRDGKEELNFSEYGSYSKKRQFNKLRSIGESLEKGTMPLKSYRIMHADARLTEAEKAVVLKWVEDTRRLIKEGKE